MLLLVAIRWAALTFWNLIKNYTHCQLVFFVFYALYWYLQMGSCLLCSQEESIWTPHSWRIHDFGCGIFWKAQSSQVLTCLLTFSEMLIFLITIFSGCFCISYLCICTCIVHSLACQIVNVSLGSFYITLPRSTVLVMTYHFKDKRFVCATSHIIIKSTSSIWRQHICQVS